MQKKNHSGELDTRLARVCGLYCGACRFFIATTEDPARLKKLAAQYQLSEEAIKCYGCRAAKGGFYCQKCKMSVCVAEKGIDFGNECRE